jgi:hypothetical protein
MGSGGGGSTTIEPEKPILVQTYSPRSVLYAAGELARNRSANLARATSSYNAATDDLLGRPRTTTYSESGDIISPFQVNVTPNYAVAYDPEQNPYLKEEMEQAAKQRANQRKRQQEKQKDQESERNNYLNAVRSMSVPNDLDR